MFLIAYCFSPDVISLPIYELYANLRWQNDQSSTGASQVLKLRAAVEPVATYTVELQRNQETTEMQLFSSGQEQAFCSGSM